MSAFTLPTSPGAEEGGGETQFILIVDDEARMRASMHLLLAEEGRVILEADCGRAAIEQLAQRRFDLVLLDLGMPDISGLEVMRWMSEQDCDTEVIVVSGETEFDFAIRALRYGAVEFLRKPQELDGLSGRVDATLERRRMQREHARMTNGLIESERLHRFLVENSPDIVYTLDEQGRFVFLNDRVERLLGFSREELRGSHWSTIVPESERHRYALAERRTGSRATTNTELRLVSKPAGPGGPEARSVVSMVSSIGLYAEPEAPGGSPRFNGSYGVLRDITERKRAEEEINFQALHDPLTGLPNRRLFKDHLELALAQAARRERIVGVMFVDLDRFKRVNDSYGHREGDELLKAFAQRLRQCLRAGDTVARQGSDEFTVLLPDLTSADDAPIIANKIFAELERPFLVGGHELLASVSIGIATYPRDGSSEDLLLKHADIAMRKVKSSGRNGGQMFSAEMSTGYAARLELEHDLRFAIGRGEMVLHYQPQISVAKGQIVGVEALVRWQHPRHGLLGPGAFVALAEESGRIAELSDWVLDEACRQLSHWHHAGHTDLRMAVNLSPLEVLRADLVDRVASRIDDYSLPEAALEVEITENVLLHDVSGVIRKLKRLRDLGVRIAMDDFGTQYSSLNYLRHFPLTSIKVDQSFVRDIVPGQPVSPIIQAVVGIARGLGRELLAEGVETAYQLEQLADQGCDEMQGYLFGRPSPPRDVELLFGVPVLKPRATPDRGRADLRVARP